VTEPVVTPTLSRATIHRRLVAVKQVLMSTPKSFAKIVEKVIITSTPRKRDALTKTGIDVRRSLENELVLQSVQQSISDLKKRPRTTGNIKMARIIVQAAINGTKRKRRMIRYLGAS